MEQDDDKNILQHLLHLEAEAASLVDGAQAEADRRLSESEKQSRILFDKSYSEEIERLEAAFADEISAVRKKYNKQLEDYREELMNRSLNKAAFTVIAEKYLLEENPPKDV